MFTGVGFVGSHQLRLNSDEIRFNFDFMMVRVQSIISGYAVDVGGRSTSAMRPTGRRCRCTLEPSVACITSSRFVLSRIVRIFIQWVKYIAVRMYEVPNTQCRAQIVRSNCVKEEGCASSLAASCGGPTYIQCGCRCRPGAHTEPSHSAGVGCMCRVLGVGCRVMCEQTSSCQAGFKSAAVPCTEVRRFKSTSHRCMSPVRN